MPEIVFRHATKAFDEESGLFDFSIEIEKGQAFGLLGPAGAGKSTALSLLMGFLKPDEGEVQIRGLDCFAKRYVLMKDIGFVPRDAQLPPRTTGESFFRLLSAMRGDQYRRRAQKLMEQLDINPLGNWHHMLPDARRKVVLLLGLLHDAPILLLDEPCAGLDPNARNAMLELIAEERKAGKTIFMVSHVFEEVQRTCDMLGIIRQGRLVTVQSAQSLSYTRQKVYHITFADIAQAAAFAQEWETGVELLRNRVIVAVPASPQVLLKTLVKYDVLDLVGGREELEDSLLRAFGGDLV